MCLEPIWPSQNKRWVDLLRLPSYRRKRLRYWLQLSLEMRLLCRYLSEIAVLRHLPHNPE